MNTYRVRLRPLSAFLSRWQADTIFGHLCWAIRNHEGEHALHRFLEPFHERKPPLVLSNGFPGDFVPRPMIPPQKGYLSGRLKNEQVEAMREQKRIKDLRYVTLDEFSALCRGHRPDLATHEEMLDAETILKNQINRLTGGTTPLGEEEGGNLYSVEEQRFINRRTGSLLPITVYIKAIDDEWRDKAHDLLQRVSLSGFGAKKSAGYGQFEVQAFESFEGFGRVPEANGFVSLSNFVPASGDPHEGHYRLIVKYGKLGEDYAASGDLSPFKWPLLMLAAGATFYAPQPRPFYGRLVKNVHPENKDIVQYGYAFAAPVNLV